MIYHDIVYSMTSQYAIWSTYVICMMQVHHNVYIIKTRCNMHRMMRHMQYLVLFDSFQYYWDVDVLLE